MLQNPFFHQEKLNYEAVGILLRRDLIGVSGADFFVMDTALISFFFFFFSQAVKKKKCIDIGKDLETKVILTYCK